MIFFSLKIIPFWAKNYPFWHKKSVKFFQLAIRKKKVDILTLEKSEATLSVFSIPAIILRKYASYLDEWKTVKSWCTGTGNFGFLLLLSCNIDLWQKISLGFQLSIFDIMYKVLWYCFETQNTDYGFITIKN